MKCLRPGGLCLTSHALSYGHISPQTRLLDIGCGNGESLRWIREKFLCVVAGLEPKGTRQAQAQQANPKAQIKAGWAEDIPFADQIFDLVLVECTASLFEQPKRAFQEINRVLAKHGTLILTDVYAGKPADAQGDGLLRHLYTIEQFRALLEGAGFALEHWEDCGKMLKTMMGQLILEYGAAEAYQLIGLERDLFKNVQVGYALLVAQKES